MDKYREVGPQHPPYEPPFIEPTYREKRRNAYVEQFSPEQTFETAVGDSIDAIMDFIETRTINPKLQDLLDKRAAIKEQFPKV